MSLVLYFSMLLCVAPIFILIFGLFWAFGDKEKDKQEYEENKDELNKY